MVCMVGVTATLVNAYFDPTLESPQAAIWLWTVRPWTGHRRENHRTEQERHGGRHALLRMRLPPSADLVNLSWGVIDQSVSSATNLGLAARRRSAR
jgi:hypothetical protein